MGSLSRFWEIRVQDMKREYACNCHWDLLRMGKSYISYFLDQCKTELPSLFLPFFFPGSYRVLHV